MLPWVTTEVEGKRPVSRAVQRDVPWLSPVPEVLSPCGFLTIPLYFRIPFFFTTIPGAETPNKEIAKNTYNFHKNAGQAYEYLVPLHAGGSLLHVIRGHKVFERLSIFNKASKVV